MSVHVIQYIRNLNTYAATQKEDTVSTPDILHVVDAWEADFVSEKMSPVPSFDNLTRR